jgi:hypothetical protein
MSMKVRRPAEFDGLGKPRDAGSAVNSAAADESE